MYLSQDAEDAALVGRVLAGDMTAFETLVERYQRPLFGVATRMLGSREDAADATQNALVRIYENLRAFAPDETPVLWPEHFDLGITAGPINYGASPGDAQVADPYLYVGPHDGPPPGDPAFWNAPFGAVRTIDQIVKVALQVCPSAG